ncbi:MAG TPA: dodecin domain-containing protein [Roseiarcus sp.]|nr:dodecin domain-containing protein [Roseiarcus sp.]
MSLLATSRSNLRVTDPHDRPRTPRRPAARHNGGQGRGLTPNPYAQHARQCAAACVGSGPGWTTLVPRGLLPNRGDWRRRRRFACPINVYKVIELVSTNEESWEKAAKAAVGRAAGLARRRGRRAGLGDRKRQSRSLSHEGESFFEVREGKN